MSRFRRVKAAIREIFRRDEEQESKHAAIRRLKLVLISDRTTVSPHILDNLKSELVEVLSKYMEIDSTRIQINMEKEDNDVAITASLPVKKVVRGEGQERINKHEQQKQGEAT